MLLQTEAISKAFHGVYALRDVSLTLNAGEVHGLVGENGAGKSTLIKLLTGVYSLREGRILWEGQPVSITCPEDAQRLGICVIHQERTLVPSFSGVENAYLGRPYPTRFGLVDWNAMTRRVQETAERLGMTLNLRCPAGQLSPPQQTELEIVRAMLWDCRLLILDEPTASLTDREAERLFALLHRLREQGTAILYVSHRLDEIFRLTDRITILRNGRLVETTDTNQLTQPQLIARMTDGAPAVSVAHRQNFGAPLLTVRNLSSKDGRVKHADLTAHSGEILGIFGLGGSGRTELLECIYGYRPRSGGTVSLEERELVPSPESALKGGMVLLSEDRKGKVMASGLSVAENILLASYDRFARHGIVRERAAKNAVAEQVDDLQIRLRTPEQQLAELSGGNQQKAVFARMLLCAPKVFLCDEPTQAVDVGTRAQIHKLLRQQTDAGAAVVYVSSDLTELLEVADTVQIVSNGKTGACLPNRELTAQQVLTACYDSESTRC